MSQENMEILRRANEAFNRGDLEGLLGKFDPDVEWLPHRAATEGAYRGPAGIKRFITDTTEVFEKYELHFEYADLGERVLAWGHVHVRARGSGIETDIEAGGIFDFREGKIVRWEDFGTKEKALEALGLSEQDAHADS
jgi:ketosteroid isomerase-like protein